MNSLPPADDVSNVAFVQCPRCRQWRDPSSESTCPCANSPLEAERADARRELARLLLKGLAILEAEQQASKRTDLQ
jgi:hypothetical protein